MDKPKVPEQSRGGVIDDGGTGSDTANSVGQTPNGRSEGNAGTVAPESRDGQANG